jgi:cation diffusion facilitator family transporter
MEILYKTFIKNYKNIKDPRVQKKYGLLASIVGIILNSILFLAKIVIALLSGSISIISDAFNNLSDASSSVITLIGFKMSSKPADKEHPYGHQRIEYICAFILTFNKISSIFLN